MPHLLSAESRLSFPNYLIRWFSVVSTTAESLSRIQNLVMDYMQIRVSSSLLLEDVMHIYAKQHRFVSILVFSCLSSNRRII